VKVRLNVFGRERGRAEQHSRGGGWRFLALGPAARPAAVSVVAASMRKCSPAPSDCSNTGRSLTDSPPFIAPRTRPIPPNMPAGPKLAAAKPARRDAIHPEPRQAGSQDRLDQPPAPRPPRARAAWRRTSAQTAKTIARPSERSPIRHIRRRCPAAIGGGRIKVRLEASCRHRLLRNSDASTAVGGRQA